MNKSFKLLAIAVLAGGSHLALAQPTKASFADTFAEMQALSSNSSQWQPTQASVDRGAAAPESRLSLRDYQALASNSSQWQFDQGRVRVDNGPTFARTHPQGIPFAEYQAVAANSDQYATRGDVESSSIAAFGRTTTAGSNGSTRDRWMSFFRRSAPASTQDD